MKVFRTLLRRELGVCFGVLNGYVIVSAALFLVGVCFYDLVYRLNTQPSDMTLTEMFFFSWYFWLILLLSTPLITMRTFAHESPRALMKMMTAPVSDVEVLLINFCGALFFHAIIWLPVFISMLLLRFYIHNPLVVNVTSILTTYFAVLMVGALYISIGCFGSALTRSQIVAGMVSFTLGMGIFMLSVNVLFVVPEPGQLSLILAKISLADYMRDCSRGILDSRPFLFILSSTFLFLFLTWRVLEWRRWR